MITFTRNEVGKRMKSRRNYLKILMTLFAVFTVSNCSDNTGSQATKQLLEAQKKISAQNDTLSNKNEQLEKNLVLTQKESEYLKDQLLHEKINLLGTQKNQAVALLQSIQDSIKIIDDQIRSLNLEKTRFDQQQKYSVLTLEQANTQFHGNVEKIDAEMDAAEAQIRAEQKNIRLNQEENAIVEKKILALKEEMQFYENKKSDQLRENAPEIEIAATEEKLRQLKMQILQYQNSQKDILEGIKNSEAIIAQNNQRITTLNEQIVNEYKEKNVVRKFSSQQKEMLIAQQAALLAKIDVLVSKKNQLEDEEGRTVAMIADIGRRIAELQLTPQTAANETSTKLEEPTEALPIADLTRETDEELPQAPPIEARKDNGFPWKIVIGSLFALFLLAFLVFYFIGKRHKSSKHHELIR